MLVDLRFFSKPVEKLAFLVIGASLLGGCSMSSSDSSTMFERDNRTLLERLANRPKSTSKDLTITGLIKKDEENRSELSGPKANEKVELALKTPPTNSLRAFDDEPGALEVADVDKSSAACRYLIKSAQSEAAIVGSPTLSATSDEEGSGSVSLGMNLLDVNKAKLIRDSGDAKCRLQEASKKIESTLGLSIEATRYARASAKYTYLQNRLGKMDQIDSSARRLTQQGALTIQDANIVTQRVSELKSEMERFKAEARQRSELPSLNLADVRSRHGALVEAVNDLQNIERDIRTNDALELSVSAGYQYNDRFDNGVQQSENDGAFARVTLGIRLGALSAQRRRLENEAAGARLDALYEENTGTIWKSGFSERATGRMMTQLKNSEAQLTSALLASTNTVKKLTRESRPETARARLMAELDAIRIGSDRAAVRGAIKQLRKNKQKIRALSY